MIHIVCTKQLTTGGAELLHQLCYELNTINIDSNMSYYLRQKDEFIETGINKNYIKYCKYDKSSKIEDIQGNVIIFPETMAYLAREIKNAKVVIWWLSIDNYLINFNYDFYKNNGFKPTLHELKKVFRRPSFDSLKVYSHIVQSQYAKDFLFSKGIDSDLVSDYINTDFIEVSSQIEKKNIICYNPKKGLEISKKIIRFYESNNKNLEFVPIIGLNSEGVKNLMRKSKIYIDFGGHPGKDRMPREARIQDCVIITGRRGSANNKIDVFIDDDYKIDEKSSFFIDKLDKLIIDVIGRFEFHLNNQKEYQLRIMDEKNQFAQQVSDLMKKLVVNE